MWSSVSPHLPDLLDLSVHSLLLLRCFCAQIYVITLCVALVYLIFCFSCLLALLAAPLLTNLLLHLRLSDSQVGVWSAPHKFISVQHATLLAPFLWSSLCTMHLIIYMFIVSFVPAAFCCCLLSVAAASCCLLPAATCSLHLVGSSETGMLGQGPGWSLTFVN